LDHHPEAVLLPLDRACPEEIREGKRFSSIFPWKLFYRRSLFAEDRWVGDWKNTIPPSLMIQIPPASTPTSKSRGRQELHIARCGREGRMIIPCFDLWQDDQACSRDSFTLPFFDTTQGVRIQEEGKKEKPEWEKGLTGPARAFKIQVASVLV
jgi:hypothetical protein